MSNTSNPLQNSPRLLRLLGDLTGLAAGVVIAVLSLHDPSLATTGLGIGLATVAGAHLEEDLNLSGS